MKTITEYLINNHVKAPQHMNQQQPIKQTVANFISLVLNEEDPFSFSIRALTKILDNNGFSHLYSGKTKYTQPPFNNVRDFINFLSANKNEKINLYEEQLNDGRFRIKFSVEHDNTTHNYQLWNFYLIINKSIKSYFDI